MCHSQPAGVEQHFIAGVVTANVEHPVGMMVGDLIVREKSATGRGRSRSVESKETVVLGGNRHFDLARNPDVIGQIRMWLSPNSIQPRLRHRSDFVAQRSMAVFATIRPGVLSRPTFASTPTQSFRKAKGASSARQWFGPTDVSNRPVASVGCWVGHEKVADMTQQETFKRRIRERMERTGERYTAARRVLIDQTSELRSRTWIAEPEMSEESVLAATGSTWDEWCDLIDAWPGHTDGHTAIAAYLVDEHAVDSWWAQTVTVGYERITGLRLPYQRADGTFTAGKSATVTIDAELLRSWLLDTNSRADLFPGVETILRSGPTAKVVRLGIGDATVQIALDPMNDGRTKISVAHERLARFEEVEEWKFYWSEWLEAIDAR